MTCEASVDPLAHLKKEDRECLHCEKIFKGHKYRFICDPCKKLAKFQLPEGPYMKIGSGRTGGAIW